MDKDIIIIGGGPGGYVAAIRAAQLGAKVCIIEKDKLGGTCLNRGCVPTKALYRNAEILNIMKNVDEYGISVENYSVDVDKIHKRKNEIVEQLVGGIEQLLKANNIEVISGNGTLKDNNTVSITLQDGTYRELTASNIVIAVGSNPAVLPIPGAALDGILTSEEILNFKSIPESLAIIGGGVVGIEFAGIFNSMGTKITVVEFMPNILPGVDTDLTKRLTPMLKKKGIAINSSTKVTRIEKEEEGYILYCQGKKGEVIIKTAAVLIAVGRVPRTHDLNLDKLGINFDKKGIEVDENYETNIKGIYAIGDVNGRSMLAHAASHQGIKAVEHIMGYEQSEAADIIPSCIFIFPEIAAVGITEDEAKAQNIAYKTSKFMFGANCKAMTLGEPEGMVKVISDGETILGVHIMGPHASDLIQEAALAVRNKLPIEAITNTIHAHPTLSEAFLEAVLGIKGEAIHMVNINKA